MLQTSNRFKGIETKRENPNQVKHETAFPYVHFGWDMTETEMLTAVQGELTYLPLMNTILEHGRPASSRCSMLEHPRRVAHQF